MQPDNQPNPDQQPYTPAVPYEPEQPAAVQEPARPEYSSSPLPPSSDTSVPSAPSPTPVEDDTLSTPAPQAETPQPTPSEIVEEHKGTNQSEIMWQAPEYVHKEHSKTWYIIVIVVALLLMALSIFVIKSPTFAILLPIMTVALFLYAHHGPDSVNYILDNEGFHTPQKTYPFANFKAFSLMEQEGHHSFMLIPRKRFQMGQTAFFPAEMGEQIVDMLGARLPMQDKNPDFYDRIITKLRM